MFCRDQVWRWQEIMDGFIFTSHSIVSVLNRKSAKWIPHETRADLKESLQTNNSALLAESDNTSHWLTYINVTYTYRIATSHENESFGSIYTVPKSISEQWLSQFEVTFTLITTVNKEAFVATRVSTHTHIRRHTYIIGVV